MSDDDQDFLSTATLVRPRRRLRPYALDAVAVTLLIGVMAGLFYGHRIRQLEATFERDAKSALTQAAHVLQSESDLVRVETLLLTGTPAQQSSLNLASGLRALIRLRSPYRSAVQIDSAGHLVARVDREGEQQATEALASFSTKLVQRALTLGPGRFYASEPTYTTDGRERGAFVIFIAAPLFDRSLQRLGAIILVYDATALARSIAALHPGAGVRVQLLSSAGENLELVSSHTRAPGEYLLTEDVALLSLDSPHLLLRAGPDDAVIAAARRQAARDSLLLWAFVLAPLVLMLFARDARRQERMSALALAESQRRLLEAERLAHIGYWRWDEPQDRLLLSPEAATMLGRRPGEQRLSLADATALHDLADQHSFVERIRHVIKTGETSAADVRVMSLRGTRWVHSIMQPVRNAKREIVGIFGTLQDITARKTAEEELRALQTDYSALLDHIPAGVAYLDLKERLILVNQTVLDENKLQRADVEGYAYEKLFDRGESARRRALFAEVIRTEQPARNQIYRHQTQDGSTHWTRSDVIPRRDANGRVIGVVVFGMNITDLKLAEQQLRSVTAEREMILDRIPAFVLYRDRNGYVVHANSMTASYTGKSLQEIEGQHAAALLQFQNIRAADEEVLRTGQRKGGLIESIVRENGSIRTFEVDILPNLDESGNVIGSVMFGLDITERLRAEEQVKYLAMHDPLTDLCNRRLLQERLAQTVASCIRQARRCALLFVDLDRFKEVNDRHGHDIGDALLVDVAERLKRCVRMEDTVARTGGDEFIVLVTDTSSVTDGVLIAEKIRAALAAPFEIHGTTIEIGSSIGVACLPEHGDTEHGLLSAADTAMYRAKTSGRNLVCVAEQPRLSKHANS